MLWFVALAALLLVSPLPVQAWTQSGARLTRIPLARLSPVTQETSADFDRDGRAETLLLQAGHASIQSGARSRWQSPPAWDVRQGLIADLDHDGLPEAVLLVWRPFKGWPVDAWLPHGGRIEGFQDAQGQSCHIILIGWAEGAFRERWAGSALAEPVREMAAADLAGDGRPYLVTLEGEYQDPSDAAARRLKVWEWNGFGFTVVSELDGPFRQMVIGQAESGQILILAP